MTDRVIISDASALITLSRINKLNILQDVYSEIYITSIVRNEYGNPLPAWINVKDPVRHNLDYFINLDNGEASSIALALENENSLLIIDEKKGRRVARSLKLNVIGLLGIIIQAKELEYLESVSDLLMELDNAEFRISDSLKETVLKLANEE